MSDTYQAVYDAVRSRISSCSASNITDVVRDCFDISLVREQLRQEFAITADEMRRPSVLYRPTLSQEGAQWCVLYGTDLHTGVCGFGETPAKAMADFDAAWARAATAEAARADS